MYKLIIADDVAMVRTGLYYRNDWNSMGFEVVGLLEDGIDVLRVLEEQRVDVILLDIRMRQMGGLEVANVIREKYPWMKVVLISGHQEFEYAREAIRCQVYEYLVKPINYNQLKRIFAKIKEELDVKQREKLLLKNIGEEEYGQILEMVRTVTNTVLEDDKSNWLAYIRLKSFLNSMPVNAKSIIVKNLLDLLNDGLKQKDPQLAMEFARELNTLNIYDESELEGNTPLMEILMRLKDEIISRNLVSARKNSYNDCISKACMWIDNHFGENFTYRDVADFVHLSPSHFIRRFRKETGETFTDYILRVRMEAAMNLIERKEIPLEDIGGAVGYQDEKYFQQLFKKYVGCTVKEYQNKG